MSKRYFAYEIQNIQPLRITDLDSSKSGENVTLPYLPGSSLRGMIVGRMQEHMAVEAEKKKILKNAMFLNGYPMYKKQELVPSPKGFNEDKRQEGNLENALVSSKFKEGLKRANLGRFCEMSNDTISYTSVKQQEAERIRIKDETKKDKKNRTTIFRQSEIKPGQTFRAYIAVDEKDNELCKWIKEAVEKESICYIGAGRTSGCGKCQIRLVEAERPYVNIKSMHQDEKTVYMYLVSDLCMQNDWGELCGIDEKKIGELLDNPTIKIKKASTSTCKRTGINRTWGCRTPEAVMYEAGSVFQLTAEEGVIKKEAMERVQQSGIGIKKEEGCGQVLFLEEYIKLNKKEPLVYKEENFKQETALNKEEQSEQIHRVAKAIGKKRIEDAMQNWVIHSKEKTDGISNSQLGILLRFVQTGQVRDNTKEIRQYIKHEKEKIQKDKRQGSDREKRKAIAYMEEMLTCDFFELIGFNIKQSICGIQAEELFRKEERIYRMKLLEESIRFQRMKKGEGE